MPIGYNVQQIKPMDLVKGFKYERLTDDQRSKNIHIYEVLGFGYHTESGEKTVIYKALASGEIWVTPYEMFMSEVNHKIHPDIKQKYCFEKITDINK